MSGLFQDYGTGLIIVVGIICILAVISLCLKTSNKASFNVEHATDEPDITLTPEIPIVTLKLNSLEELLSCHVKIKGEDEILQNIEDPLQTRIEDGMTKIDLPYAEIDLECRPTENYSSIQEVKQTKDMEAKDISDVPKPDNSDYSTIDIPDKVQTSYNPYSTIDGENVEVPPTPKARERKNLISNAFEPTPDNSNLATKSNVPENISQLYSKVDKHKNCLNIEKKENLIGTNRRTKSLENLTDYYSIKELRVLKNTVFETLKKCEQKSKSPFEDLYSKINKNKKAIAGRNSLTDALIQKIFKKSASEDANIYSCIADNFRGVEVMDGQDNTEEELQTYEEINFHC